MVLLLNLLLRVRESLNRQLPGKWIARGGPLAWPARSPDVTPLDFFFWDYVKDCVFSNPLKDIEGLKDRITEVITLFNTDMLANTWVELRRRLEFLHENEGQYNEIHQWDFALSKHCFNVYKLLKYTIMTFKKLLDTFYNFLLSISSFIFVSFLILPWKLFICYFTEIPFFFQKWLLLRIWDFWSDQTSHIHVFGIKQNRRCHRISCKKPDVNILIRKKNIKDQNVVLKKKNTLYRAHFEDFNVILFK